MNRGQNFLFTSWYRLQVCSSLDLFSMKVYDKALQLVARISYVFGVTVAWCGTWATSSSCPDPTKVSSHIWLEAREKKVILSAQLNTEREKVAT